MLKRQTVNQATACVRTAPLHVDFEVPCNSQLGCVAQPRTRLVGYAGYGLLSSGGSVQMVCIWLGITQAATVSKGYCFCTAI